jgi:outer membrane murein-binding lipoprotein Lpp
MVVERGKPSRISELERKVAQLECEKNELEASLSAAKADAESALQAAREESEIAKVEAAEARRQLDT